MIFLKVLKILFFQDLINFLDFWFLHLPKNLIRNFFDRIYILEKTFKLKVHLRNFAKPLYGDYSFIGFLIAIPYRLINIMLAFFIYFLIFLFYIAVISFLIFFPFIVLIYGILL